MKGKSAALTGFICPTPLQDVPLDLTPTSGTPSTSGGISITPLLTPNTWASIEQVFKDLTGTPQAETPNGDGISSSRSTAALALPPVVEAVHDESHRVENLSLKKPLVASGSTSVPFVSQPLFTVIPKQFQQFKAEKPAIVAATTTTADASISGSGSSSQRRKAVATEDANDDAPEANKVVMRRERNRMAAARCRQRRVDLTQSLLEETRALKAEKMEIQEQLQRVQQQKEHLEFILQAHEALCKVKLMAPEVLASMSSLPLTAAAAAAAAAAKCVVHDDEADDDLSPQQAHSVSSGAAKRPSSLLLASQSDGPVAKKERV